MNIRNSFFLGAAAALVVLGGCAVGPEIRTDYDAEADFSRFSTFAFMDREERSTTRSYDTLDDRRVITAVTRELEARGYRRVDENPDLLVNFAVVTQEIEELRAVPMTSYPWYGWRGGYYHPWPAYGYETYVDRYELGTLFVDLVDRQRRQLVWEGRVSGRVTEAARENPAGALDSAVSEIFARYPFVAPPFRATDGLH